MTEFLAMLILAAAGSASFGQEPPPPKTEPPPPQGDLGAWAAQVRPEIETIAGAKFTAEVPIKVVSADQLAQLLAEPVEKDMAGSKRANGAPMTEVEIHIHATAAAYKVASRTFGMYHYPDKTVYVIPENALLYAKHHAWSTETAERVPRLAVVHELVHALQDQKTHLGDRLAKSDGDARAALVCVTEGHAVWVTEQVAAKHDWGVADAMLWGIVTGVQETTDPKSKYTAADPVVRAAPSAELYTLGKEYMKSQAAKVPSGKSAAERLWEIVAKPPAMTEIKPPAAPSKGEPSATPPTKP